jgi:tetratricopeptide (TPR) repeat protein
MDNDILSAMLTAIKDFIKDAFTTDSKGELNELKYGKLNVMIEHGQFVFLAVVISGTPPKNLRNKMKRMLVDINKRFYNQLKVFNGIPKQFEPVKGMIFQNLLASEEDSTYMDEGSDSFWNNKGVVQTKLGKYNEALDCFDRALKINPGVTNIWLNRGIALVKLNEFEEAMDCFDRALQLDPNNESAKRRRNKCWYKWKLLEAREDGITDVGYSSRKRHRQEPGYDYDYYDYGPEPTPTTAPASTHSPTPAQTPSVGPGGGYEPGPSYASGGNYQDTGSAATRCPDCGQPLRFIEEYESWYCEPCDIYPYDD